MKRTAIAIFVVTIGISFSVYAAEIQSRVPEKQIETANESYVPGMGEIMGATQMRQLQPCWTNL